MQKSYNYLAPYNEKNFESLTRYFKSKNIKIHAILTEKYIPLHFTSNNIPIFPINLLKVLPGNVFLTVNGLGNILKFSDMLKYYEKIKLYISYTIPQFGYIYDFEMKKLRYVINNLFQKNDDLKWLKLSLSYINNYAVFKEDIFFKRIHLSKQFLENKENIYFYKLVKPKPGDIVIDAGAGGEQGEDYIEVFLNYIKNGKIFAFEPFKKYYFFLKNKYKKYKNVEIINKALSDKVGKAYLIYNGSASYVSYNKGKYLDNTPCKVNLISIDEFVKKKSLKKVNFIKMDIEGSEYKALLGAKETIKKFKPKLAICVYHHPKDLYKIPLLIKNLNPKYKIWFRVNELTNCYPLLGAKIFAY